MQEFYYAHPKTKLLLNNIYNTHFTGSVIWNLFSREAKMIENTWNVSIRKMMNLDRQTHRYMVEPSSDVRHIKFVFLKRFLKFTEKLEKSVKHPVRVLFNAVKQDCRSTTGSNLRRIMHLVKRTKVSKVKKKGKEGDEWRLTIMKELLSVYRKELKVEDFDKCEFTEILDHICTT